MILPFATVMTRAFRSPTFPVTAALLLWAPLAHAQLDNPDPPTPDTVTRFDITQGLPAGSSMDVVRKLPHRDSYLVYPDRTGQIKLSVDVEHTFTGSVDTRLVDNHGTLLHTFTAGSGTFNINCIQFRPPFHLLVVNPSGEAVSSQTLVTPEVLRGPDGPGYIGGASTSNYGIQIPPYMGGVGPVSHDKGGSEGDNGEDGNSSCGSCSSCDQSTAGEQEGVRAEEDRDDEPEVSPPVDAQTDDGSFDATQPAGVSANGDSLTNLDALVDPGTGIRHNDIKVHGNGDSTVTRNVDGEITSVETSSAYSKVEEVTTTHGTAIKISQWKLKSLADISAAPYRTILFENTDTNELTRTNTFAGHAVETVWRYTPGTQKKWEVITGNGLRREEAIREDDGTDPGRYVIRRKQYERAAGASGEAAVLVSDIRQTFQYQSFGWKKTKLEVFGMDNGPLISVWEYWQSNEDSHGQGLLKRYAGPDGFEIDYSYSEAGGTHTMTANSSPLNGDSGLGVQNVHTSTANGYYTTHQERIGSATDIGFSMQTTWSGSGGNEFSISILNGRGGSQDVNGRVYPFGGDHGGQADDVAPFPTYGETINQVRNTTADTLTITHKKGKMTGGAVVDGTVTEVVLDKNGVVIRRSSWDILTNILLEDIRATALDVQGRPTTLEYHFETGLEWTESLAYDCCGLSSFTDRDGIASTFTYDDLRRRITTVNRGVTHQTVYDGLVVRTNRKAATGAAAFLSYTEISNRERNIGGTVTINRSRSSQDGTLVASSTVTEKYRNPESITVNPYALPDGIGRRAETLLPLVTDDNSIAPAERSDYFFDGRLYETRGNLGTNLRYTFSMDDAGGTKYFTSRTQRMDGLTGREAALRRVDWAGNPTHTSSFGDSVVLYYYNTDDLLVKTVDGDGVTWIYEYNELRERKIEALDVNGNGAIDYGTDQVTIRETKPVDNGTADVLRTTTKVGKPDGTEVVVSYREVTPDGLRTWERSFPTTGSGYGVSSAVRTLGTTANPGDWTLTATGKDGTISRAYHDNGNLLAKTFWTSGSTPPATAPANITAVATAGFVNGTSYGYDVLQRPTTTTDSRTGATTWAYNATTPAARDEVAKITDPGSRVTAFTYDHRGRRTTVDAPNTTSGGSFTNITTTTRYPDGSVKEVDGGQGYRTAYTYDYAIRLKTLVTYGTSTATTTWIYDSSGRLQSKDDNSGKGPSYTYTGAGRLKTRTWERGRRTRYDRDAAGRLDKVRYFLAPGDDLGSNAGNDTLTPDVDYDRDCLGRVAQVLQDGDGSGSDNLHVYGYDADTLQLETEKVVYGSDLGSTPHLERRLYRPADSLLRTQGYELAAPDGGGGWLAFEHLAGYEYDTAGRLYRVKDHDNRYYTYDYTPEAYGLVAALKRAHVIGAQEYVRVESTWTYQPDRDFLEMNDHRNVQANSFMSRYTYSINELGQRTGITTAGGGYGTNFNWTWSYDADGQLTSANRAVGTAHDRYYAYDGIGNRTQHRDGTATSTGGTATTYTPNALNQYSSLTGGIAKSPVHDDDGNLTSGVLPANLSVTGNYVWDGENRLVEAKSGTTTVGTYRYDYRGRRISKTVGGNTTRFIYDGWNLVAEYTSAPALLRGYTWGLDLSGTPQGAGGVGGLLRVKEFAGSFAGVHYPLCDGNGNVTQVVTETNNNSTRIANREEIDYDPYGSELRMTGGYAAAVPFRFSSKYFDAETGLLYYGYRYYDSVTGRWPSRDPIEEEGGVNLYGFLDNHSLNAIDILGLAECYFLLGADQGGASQGKDSAYKAVEKAAKDKNAKVVDNSSLKDLDQAMGDPECKLIVYYNHGFENKKLEVSNSGVPGGRDRQPPHELFNPDKVSPKNKKGITIVVVCCHHNVIRTCKKPGGNVSLAFAPVEQIQGGDDDGKIRRHPDAYNWIEEFFNDEGMFKNTTNP